MDVRITMQFDERRATMRKEMKQILAAILATILVVSCGFVPAAATDANSEQEKAGQAQIIW